QSVEARFQLREPASWRGERHDSHPPQLPARYRDPKGANQRLQTNPRRNRVIVEKDVDAIYICGPGHGGPGVVAHSYLEGTYSEVYPNVPEDAAGMKRLFHQFSFPGGIPSHAAPETPGSIHEGGELGYALLHAYGAAFDNPDLL